MMSLLVLAKEYTFWCPFLCNYYLQKMSTTINCESVVCTLTVEFIPINIPDTEYFKRK